MRFFSLVARNVVRQRLRTVLTILGIGIGVTTVIALGAITSGLKASSVEMAHTGGADFMVAQKGAADLSFSTLPASAIDEIRAAPGVSRAWGVLMHISRVGTVPFFFTYGIEPTEVGQLGLTLRSGGRMPQGDGEIAIGAKAAEDLGVDTGARLTIEHTTFEVVGVFDGGGRYEQIGGYAPLAAVQKLAQTGDTVTVVYVIVDRNVDPNTVKRRLEAASDRYATIATAAEYSEVDQGLEALDAGNLAISMLAVVIGAIGVMNTMIMSVFERTREIGVLRAVGWSGGRVVRMILGESLVLCLIATVAGVGAGFAVTRAVLLVPAVGSFLSPAYPTSLFVRAVVIAVVVAIAGALYPALRAVRLSPLEALRYE
ncbi:MAG: FtsX-like permease family protein [Gaiellales bacterium]